MLGRFGAVVCSAHRRGLIRHELGYGHGLGLFAFFIFVLVLRHLPSPLPDNSHTYRSTPLTPGIDWRGEWSISSQANFLGSSSLANMRKPAATPAAAGFLSSSTGLAPRQAKWANVRPFVSGPSQRSQEPE